MTLNIEQARQQGCQQLQASTDVPQLEAELLLAHTLQKNRTYLYTWPERPLTAAQQQRYQHLLAQRQQGHPIAYLTGKQAFWGLNLKVTPDTLIPRSDTETLIETILKIENEKQKKCQNPQSCLPSEGDLRSKLRFLDLGTGSGAIALALKSEYPEAEIVATDQSLAALQVAQENAQTHQLDVSFYQGDWYQALPEALPKFDYICSNPPYIEPEDPHLSQGDLRFEPITALKAEQHGLADLAHIIANAFCHLKPGGWLLVEHGYQQAPAVQPLFQQAGFQHIATQADINGQPRITYGQFPH